MTRAQLLALGLSSRAISRRIESGELVPVYSGIYAVGYVRQEARARAAAAVLACGEDAALRMNAKVAGYTVDALFPDHKVIVELDSWAYHRDRHSFESDRERDAATLAADHVTIRLTRDRQRRDPQREADRLHRILKQRGP